MVVVVVVLDDEVVIVVVVAAVLLIHDIWGFSGNSGLSVQRYATKITE